MPDLARILDMLERDGALELVSSEDPVDDPAAPTWPGIEAGEQTLEVNYGRLFPTRDPADRGFDDFDLYGDEWQLDDEAVGDILEEIGRDPHGAVPPGWDVWAWYQPIHYFGPEWGIFIREAGLMECARRIARALPPHLRNRSSTGLAKSVLRAAFAALFLHEQYHHKTESAALRMHVIERRPVYPDYHRNVYRHTAGTNGQIEEGLANADSWYRLTEKAYTKWTGRTVISATKDYLERSFLVAPPGYANASTLLYRPDFDAEQHLLFSQVQEGLAPSRTTPSEFGIAGHLNRSLFTVTQRIWTVVPSGGRTILPTHPAVVPLATTRLKRWITRNGWEEVAGAGKGSHRKFRDEEGRMIILPHAKDVSPRVLKSTAETLGVSVAELEEWIRNG